MSLISKSVSQKTALYWVHDYTMKAIVRYLKYSNMSIKEISEKLEFPNLSFFGKYVKGQFGCTPTEYRKQK